MSQQQRAVVPTFNVSIERTSRHMRASVLDCNQVVARSKWSVAELIAFINLTTDELHPRRTTDTDRQRTAAGLGRVHDELTQLTYTQYSNTDTIDNLSLIQSFSHSQSHIDTMLGLINVGTTDLHTVQYADVRHTLVQQGSHYKLLTLSTLLDTSQPHYATVGYLDEPL